MTQKTFTNAKKAKAKTSNTISKQRYRSVEPSFHQSPYDQIMFLQRTIGNQAVQRLFKSGFIQAKLKVGQPGDKYEHEADQVADIVIEMQEPKVQQQPESKEEDELQQAKPIAQQITPLVQIEVKEEEDEENKVQAKEKSGQSRELNYNLESSINSLKGGGRSLSDSERTFFEPRFGCNFEQVRVHADAQAADTTNAINAQAYTMGKDIVFGDRQFEPNTRKGRKLLAHELTHVLQQQRLEKYNNSFIQRKVSPYIEQISDDLSGLLYVSEDDVHGVLDKLKGLNDIDLRDTLIELRRDELIDSIFENISDSDRITYSSLLSRIKRLRKGITLLVHSTKETKDIICENPPKGQWEITAQIDLNQLVFALDALSSLKPQLSKLGILAHGDLAGQIKIGSTIITASNINTHKADFIALSKYLTPNAEVYIYGCISGLGSEGTTLLTKLSLLLPGRRIIGFNVITTIHQGEAKVPGEMCLWPDIRATDIRSELFRNKIKLRVPANDSAPQAKIAKDGKITKWPVDEKPKNPK